MDGEIKGQGGACCLSWIVAALISIRKSKSIHTWVLLPGAPEAAVAAKWGGSSEIMVREIG